MRFFPSRSTTKKQRDSRRTRNIAMTLDSSLNLIELEQRTLLATVIWDGGAGTYNWGDKNNWSGDNLPTALDDVVINDLPGDQVILVNVAATVLSLNSAESITVSTNQSLKVTSGVSVVNGAFTLQTTSTLTAQASANFSATGTTVIDGASLYATSGGKISLPNTVGFTNNNSSTGCVIQASGTGSTISFPGLTQFTNTDTAYHETDVEALNGGNINLSALVNIIDPATGDTNSRSFNFKADGFNSQIDLSSLVDFNDVSSGSSNGNWPGYSSLTIANNGKLLTPKLETLNNVIINHGTGTIDTSKIKVFTKGQIFATGVPAAYPSTSNIDDTSIYVSEGSTISFPLVTNYTNRSTASVLRASGTGSTISFPGLTQFTNTDTAYHETDVEALNGGNVNLSALVNIIDPATGDANSRSFNFKADGFNSQIDLSSLVDFNDVSSGSSNGNWPGYSSLTIANNGKLLTPKLETLNNVIINHGTGTIDTSKIKVFTKGQINVMSVSFAYPLLVNMSGTSFTTETTYSFPLVTNTDDVSVYANNGAKVSFPLVTNYTNRGTASVLRASGTGSTISFPGLTQFTNTDTAYHRTYVEALNGGNINLSALVNIIDPATGDTNSRSFNFKADGFNSQIDLSSLVDFNDVSSGSSNGNWPGYSSLTALNGGLLNIAKLNNKISFSNININRDLDSYILMAGGLQAGPELNAGKISLKNKGSIGGNSLTTFAGISLAPGADWTISSNLTFSNMASLQLNQTSVLRLSGNLVGGTVNSPDFMIDGKVILNGSGTSIAPQLLEVMGRDLGNDASGYSTNFVYNQLELANNTYVKLIDNSQNSGGTGAEAIYVNSLIVPAGSTLDLGGLHLYTRGSIIQGTVISGQVSQIADSGEIPFDTPTPGSISIIGESDEWTFYARAGQVISISVNPGNSITPVPITPYLNYASAELLSPLGKSLAKFESNSNGQPVFIQNQNISVDGIYTLRVRAAASNPTLLGNYVVSTWNVTPDVNSIEFNRRVAGKIENPFAVDNWTFVGIANQQLQLKVTPGSDSGIQYTLNGPNGWQGFVNLTGDSALVNLPSNGNYTLTVNGNGTLFRGAYSLQLNETSVSTINFASPASGTWNQSGQSKLYKLAVNSASPIIAQLDDSSTTNQNEIYARFGAPPTRSEYDARFASPNSPDQTLIVPRAQIGTWYFLVYGDSINAASNYTLTVQNSKIILDSISTAKASTSLDTTIEVSGAGFVTGTVIDLIDSGGKSYPATSSDIDSFARITASFNAGTVPAGVYSLRATEPGGTSAVLNSVITFVSGGSSDFRINMTTPSVLGWHGTGQIIIDYTNAGSAAMAAPLIDFTADVEGRQAGFFTLDPTIVTQGFWTSAQPEGFSPAIQFIANGASPGVLQPGETGRVVVYYAGWQQPWSFGSSFNFQASATLADNPTPLDWSKYKASLKPDNMTNAAWDIVFQNFTSQIGNTWGQYTKILSDNAVYLARLGRNVADASELLNFEIQQAIGMQPIYSLGTANDGIVSGPGIDVAIGRSFLAGIVGRNTDGPFGKGWVMTGGWSDTSSVRSDGTVVITSSYGGQRIFQPDSREGRGYFAQPGDYGVVSAVVGKSLLLTEQDGTRAMFDANGRVAYVEDSNGNRVTSTYTFGKLSRMAHSSGQWLEIQYNTAGLVSKMVDNAGRSTTYTYDTANQHLLKATYSDGRVVNYDYVTGQGAAVEHALSMIQLPNGVKQLFTYDSKGRMATAGKPDGIETASFSYDNVGTVTASFVSSAVMPASSSKIYYNEVGRVSRQQDALGNNVNYTYDRDGNLVRTTDPDGRSSVNSYDTRGNLISTMDANGNTTKFGYDSVFNKITTFTDALGRTTTYAYDTGGNLTSITDAAGNAEKWTYDSQGEAVSYTNRRDQKITYAYNTDGQLTTKALPDGSTVSYFYDTRGNLASSTDATGTTVYTFDQGTDRLTRLNTPDGHSLSFTYCTCGRRTSVTDDSGYKLSYNYDDYGRLTSIVDSASVVQVSYNYDINGRVQTKTLGNGVFTSYSYDANGNLLTLLNKAADGTVLSRYEYTYDSRGLRSSMTTEAGEWLYLYDDNGQLWKWTSPDGRSETYTYDAVGNRITLTTETGATQNYITNNLNQYTTVTGLGTYTYDADGNLISFNDGSKTTTYTYDAENNLIRVQSGSSTQTYTYNAMGQLTSANRDGVISRYQIDPTGYGNIVAEYNGSNQLVARNVHAGGLISRTSGGTSGYYTFDAIGNTSEVTGATGNVLNRYVYTPFGTKLTSQETVVNPFQFNGAYGIIRESNGLDFMRARFYDMKLGRFVEQDPLNLFANDTNFYRFAKNITTTYIDPIGLDSAENTENFGNSLENISTASKLFGHGKKVGLTPGFGLLGPGMTYNNAVIDAGGKALKKVAELERQYDQYHKMLDGFQKSLNSNNPDEIDRILKDLMDEVRRLDRRYFNDEKFWDDFRDEIEKLLKEYDKKKVNLVEAVDPNELTGPAGYGDQHFVKPDTTLNYRLDFENDKLATAPAQLVDVSNPIDANIDLSTLQFTSVGWGDTLLTIPAGRNFFRTVVPMTYKNFTFQVEVTLGVRADTRTIYAQFSSTDPATSLPPSPLIGFLPPEDGTGRGMGFFTYTLNAISDVPSGTVIRNIATITFDRGETIATNQIDPHDPSKGTDPAKEAFVTIDSISPASKVTALPASVGDEKFVVAWSGQDTNGSGIGRYSIYVKADSGPWAVWLQDTTLTQYEYQGQPGKTYAFYALATDNVGNREAKTAVAETSTKVSTNIPPVLQPISDVTLKEGDLLNITAVATDGDAGQKITYSLEGDVPSGMTIDANTGKISWKALSGPAQFAIIVRATDNGEFPRSATSGFNVAVKNVIPRISLSASRDSIIGQTWTTTGTWTDPGAQTWTGEVDYGDGTGVQPLALNPADRRISLNHTFAKAGEYQVIVTITDSSGGAFAASLLIKAASASVPVLEPIADQSVNEGSTWSTTAKATSPFGQKIYYSLSGSVPDGMTIDSNTGVVSWKPADGPASFNVTVLATDSSSQQTDTKTFKINVNNVAPTVSLANAIDAVLGNAWSLSGSWYDPGADTWSAEVDYGDGTGRNSVLLNQAGKSFELQHQFNATGTYVVSVTLRDKDGGLSTQSRSVSVQPRPAKVSSFLARTNRTKITQLELTFDTAMNLTTVQNIANYQLISAGRDGKIGTKDDTKLTISRITYNATSRVAIIKTRQGMTTSGIYRLTVLATNSSTGVKSSDGKLLDGESNSIAGGNYVKNFGKTLGFARLRPATRISMMARLT